MAKRSVIRYPAFFLIVSLSLPGSSIAGEPGREALRAPQAGNTSVAGGLEESLRTAAGLEETWEFPAPVKPVRGFTELRDVPTGTLCRVLNPPAAQELQRFLRSDMRRRYEIYGVTSGQKKALLVEPVEQGKPIQHRRTMYRAARASTGKVRVDFQIRTRRQSDFPKASDFKSLSAAALLTLPERSFIYGAETTHLVQFGVGRSGLRHRLDNDQQQIRLWKGETEFVIEGTDGWLLENLDKLQLPRRKDLAAWFNDIFPYSVRSVSGMRGEDLFGLLFQNALLTAEDVSGCWIRFGEPVTLGSLLLQAAGPAQAAASAGFQRYPVGELLRGRHELSDFLHGTESRTLSLDLKRRGANQKTEQIFDALRERKRRFDQGIIDTDNLPRMARLILTVHRQDNMATSASPPVEEDRVAPFCLQHWDPSGQGGIPQEDRESIAETIRNRLQRRASVGLDLSAEGFARGFDILERWVRGLRRYKQITAEIQKARRKKETVRPPSAAEKRAQSLADQWNALSAELIDRLIAVAPNGAAQECGPKSRIRFRDQMSGERLVARNEETTLKELKDRLEQSGAAVSLIKPMKKKEFEKVSLLYFRIVPVTGTDRSQESMKGCIAALQRLLNLPDHELFGLFEDRKAGLEELVSRQPEESGRLRGQLSSGEVTPAQFIDAVLGEPFIHPPMPPLGLVPSGAERDYRPGGIPMDEGQVRAVRHNAEDLIQRSTPDQDARRRAGEVVDAFLARLNGDALPGRPMREMSDNEAVEMVLELIRAATGVEDPYGSLKGAFNDMLLTYLDEIDQAVQSSAHPLRAAIGLGIAGNAIDFAEPAQRERLMEQGFDASGEIARAAGMTFVRDARPEFERALSRTPGGEVLFLVDNAGEIVLDLPLLKILLQEGRRVTLAGKSLPHVNDMLESELNALLADPRVQGYMGQENLGRLRVIGSGTRMTGLDLRRATPDLARAWRDAAVVYAKGQGMIETLRYALLAREVFHAVRVKEPRYFHETDDAGEPLALNKGDNLFLRTPVAAGLEEDWDRYVSRWEGMMAGAQEAFRNFHGQQWAEWVEQGRAAPEMEGLVAALHLYLPLALEAIRKKDVTGTRAAAASALARVQARRLRVSDVGYGPFRDLIEPQELSLGLAEPGMMPDYDRALRQLEQDLTTWILWLGDVAPAPTGGPETLTQEWNKWMQRVQEEFAGFQRTPKNLGWTPTTHVGDLNMALASDLQAVAQALALEDYAEAAKKAGWAQRAVVPMAAQAERVILTQPPELQERFLMVEYGHIGPYLLALSRLRIDLSEWIRRLKERAPVQVETGLEEEAMDPEIALLRDQLQAIAYPGGPVKMLADAFRDADVLILSDPSSLQVRRITQPRYSAFLGEVVDQLQPDQIFLPTHPWIARDLVTHLGRWRASRIPDLWDFLRLYPDSYPITHFVTQNLPSHWLDMMKRAIDRGIPLQGIDERGEYLADHRNARVGDPFRHPFDSETCEAMMSQLIAHMRGKALVLVDPAQAAGVEGRLGGLLKSRTGLKVITVWVGVGDGGLSGNYDLYDTGLPVVAADAQRPPLSEMKRFVDRADYERGMPIAEPHTSIPASAFDRLIYFRDMDAVPVARSVTEYCSVSARGISFMEAWALLEQSGVISGMIRDGATGPETSWHRSPAGIAFVESTGELFGDRRMGILYDLYIVGWKDKPSAGQSAIVVGYEQAPGGEVLPVERRQRVTSFPLPQPGHFPAASEEVWRSGGELACDSTIDGGARLFAWVWGLPIPPRLGNMELPWALEDLQQQEAHRLLAWGLYLDDSGVSPEVREHIRGAIAQQVTAEARFAPPPESSLPGPPYSVQMVPIHVKWETAADGSGSLAVRYEARVPGHKIFAGEYPFTVHLKKEGSPYRLAGEGRARVQPVDMPLETLDSFMTRYGGRIHAQDLWYQVRDLKDRVSGVFVLRGRPAAQAGRIHVAVHASDHQTTLRWRDGLDSQLSAQSPRDSDLKFDVAPYPLTGVLPAATPSVVVRQAGAALPWAPEPSAATIVVSGEAELSAIEPGWLYSIAMDEALRGKVIGPFVAVLTFQDEQGETLHAFFA